VSSAIRFLCHSLIVSESEPQWINVC
jgi:hypothetical protein